ncbi:baseplate J/gp47 family protein [Aneurinibacillus migulanus]|uniref:Uncharacterized phage protein gp47/JayE n=1 Tax=Aneurinibacillus migulanus TaxID=47500 RepID=A0A0D1Y743_ANEMI|nr:baseplate J/gp47 family protein [Aneurinibacillus migulanus]KIV60268.1 hypothetical protein TS65_00310 [Aneurinibacillus migulanus]KON90533.1 hypothetical protein AF333_29095 [Aneurinibacillus migulanus]MED0894878.1 baseplate J/gp47 family protein [Aneurinibacillus migulanus]MED1614478.1 baseplate J/gp47 family protein [Aneurinibacillus migulanus]SDJ76648.1 Uncharacterized phage protein gp47/JayE [Aneurinibacillus migulanus]
MSRYEDKTFENLLQQSLDEIPDDIDKRPVSSIVYDAIAPFSMRLEEAYVELDNMTDLLFPDTATGEYLDKIVAEEGVTRKLATQTIRHVQLTGTGVVRAGGLLTIDDRFFEFVEDASVPCITAIRALEYGAIIPDETKPVIVVDTVDGLQTITLVSHAENRDGVDTEDDESLRARYFIETKKSPGSGNVDDYEKWTLEVTGVGRVIVLPLWNGRGTVKLVILDSNGNPASEKLCEDVKQYIDPIDGEGQGKAPIGATVTVVPAIAVNVDVEANIELDGTRNITDITQDVTNELKTYFSELKLVSGGEITYNRVGSIIIETDGVHNYRNLTLNGDTSDIPLSKEQVHTLGTVTLNAV